MPLLEKTTALTTLTGEPHGFLSSRRDLFNYFESGWVTHIKLHAAPDGQYDVILSGIVQTFLIFFNKVRRFMRFSPIFG